MGSKETTEKSGNSKDTVKRIKELSFEERYEQELEEIALGYKGRTLGKK